LPPHPSRDRHPPDEGPDPIRIPELWRYREPLRVLVWRDIKVALAQTALAQRGWCSAARDDARLHVRLQPPREVNIPGIPYPLFALRADLWIFVSPASRWARQPRVEHPIVTKSIEPRILIPLAAVVSVFVDFLIALVLFLVIAAATAPSELAVRIRATAAAPWRRPRVRNFAAPLGDERALPRVVGRRPVSSCSCGSS